MGEIIIENVVERDKLYFYYVDGEGNLCRAKRNMTGRPKKKPLDKKVLGEVKKFMSN